MPMAREASRKPSSTKLDKTYIANLLRSPSAHEVTRGLVGLGNVKELYQAPGQVSYKMTGWSIGAILCSLAALWAHDMDVYANKDKLSLWVQPVYFGACVLFGLVGSYAIHRTHGLIKSISAVPHNNDLFLRLRVQKVAPFTQPHTLNVRPADVFIKSRSEDSKTLQRPMPKSNLAWLSYSMKRYFSNAGFITVAVQVSESKYKTYKLDSHGVFEDKGSILYKIVRSGFVDE